MLTKPNFGWTRIEIENNILPASYVTDVPMDCLENMILAYRHHIDFCVSLDAEGWTFKIISDEYMTYIIKDYIERELIVCEEVNIDNLSKELIEDIESNIDDWLLWNYSPEEIEEISEYKKNLLKKIDTLKKLINSQKT